MTTTTTTSDRGLWTGARIRMSDGCLEGHLAAGTCGTVIGNEMFTGQWWCPVLWDGEEDPSLCKSSCLEPLGELTPADWDDVLHTLTKEMRNIDSDERDRIMSILAKVGAGDINGLDSDETDEIRRSLELDAKDKSFRRPSSNPLPTATRLREIAGKFAPSAAVLPAIRLLRAMGKEELLAKCYNIAPSFIAELCDKELDPSGALLGRVRVLAEVC